MSLPSRLLLALALGGLGATAVGCDDDDTWSGSVQPWPTPSTGNQSTDLPGDGDGDGDQDPWQPSDAGMDAQVPDYDPSVSYFDPKQMYLLGSLSETSCTRSAVAPVLLPNQAVVGFSCLAELQTAQISPIDGRLLYLDDELYQFTSDTSQVPNDSNYPLRPKANDVIVPTPSCSPGSGTLSTFRFSQSGELFYRCFNDWYDGEDTFVATIDDALLLQIGADGTALTDKGIHTFASTDVDSGDAAIGDAGDDAAIDPDAGDADTSSADAGTSSGASTIRPFVGLPIFPVNGIITSRARPDGYWVVLAIPSQNTPALWHIDFAGHASQVGTFPAPPAGQQIGGSAALDHAGLLYQLARTISNARDTIVRRSVQGESTVIYDEITKPLVKIQSQFPYLITGP